MAANGQKVREPDSVKQDEARAGEKVGCTKMPRNSELLYLYVLLYDQPASKAFRAA